MEQRRYLNQWSYNMVTIETIETGLLITSPDPSGAKEFLKVHVEIPNVERGDIEWARAVQNILYVVRDALWSDGNEVEISDHNKFDVFCVVKNQETGEVCD